MENNNFWSIQFYKEKHWKYWAVWENLWYVQVSYEYVIVFRLKERCTATTSALSVYFGADIQTVILDTISH